MVLPVCLEQTSTNGCKHSKMDAKADLRSGRPVDVSHRHEDLIKSDVTLDEIATNISHGTVYAIVRENCVFQKSAVAGFQRC